MKIKDLKLYDKYKKINNSDTGYIFIGVDDENDYWFLFKDKDYDSSFSLLKRLGLNPDKIVKDLNLETCVYNSGDKYIKGYCFTFFSKNRVEIFLKPILKDKLNNILNR